MRFNNRNYPHPVLGISDDYQRGKIDVQLNVRSEAQAIVLLPIFTIEDARITDLIKEKAAVYATHVYCRGTLFREVFIDANSLAKPISIQASKLNGEVEVDFFVISQKEIAGYNDNAFNKDYSTARFLIEQSDILAYGGKAIFYANKSPEELKSISALMNIDCSQQHGKPMYLDYSGNKITILLSIEDYQHYRLLKDNRQNLGILLCSIVLPALMEALHFLDNEESDEFKNYAWYKALSELREKSEFPEPIRIAQMILDLPINRCLKSFTEDEES